MPAPVKKDIEDTDPLPDKVSENSVVQYKTINVESDGEISEKDYEPGVVVVGFKQSYTKSEIIKQFPELDIESTEDQDKLLYEAMKSTSTYEEGELQQIEEDIGTDFVIELKDKTKESVIEAIEEYDGLFIIAAGNEGQNIDNISIYTELNQLGNVIFVASSNAGTGDNEMLSSFSNYGVKNVHIAAPGEGIISTVLDGRYGYKSGTSMAAPHVTGVAALIKGKYPNLTTSEIKEAILSGVDYSVGLRGLVSTGRLNAHKAINCISDTSSLVVQPNNDETMSDAIRRSLGTKVAKDIKYLKIIGDANMADNGNATSSANVVLPNLTYVDLGSFSGFLSVYAFADCSNVTTVMFPPDNFSLRACSFWYCTKLKTIYRANSQTKIEGEADLAEFTDISDGILRETAIRTVKLPKDVAISSVCFENCTNLTNVQFHPNQTVRPAIGQDAFRNVNSSCVVYTNQLVRNSEPRIVIPRTDTENVPIKVNSLVIQPITNETMGAAIEWYLDSNNPNDIKHLVVKGSAIMGYGDSAENLPNLETADLSEFTGYTEKAAFYGCYNLKQVIYSTSNNEIPAWSFVNCESLQTIQVADKYPKIWGEIDLSNLSGVLAINTQAFEDCVNIETVKLPSTRTIGIAQYAFKGCSKLSTVYKDGQEKTIGRADLSGVSSLWSGLNFKNTGIVEVNLPLNVDIPKEAFMNCINLNKIEFDKSQTSVVTIGTQAFYNVNPYCRAYMHKDLAENSTFVLPRSATENIQKYAY